MNKSFLFFFTLLYLLNINLGVCQGLCDNPNFEKGDFVLPSDKLCLPSLLTLTDNSAGADVKYLFNYTTESFEEARVNSQSSPTYDYNSLATTTRKFTIVQTGFKNNKPMKLTDAIQEVASSNEND